MTFKILNELQVGEFVIVDGVELTAIPNAGCGVCLFNDGPKYQMCNTPREFRTSKPPCGIGRPGGEAVNFVTFETYAKLRIKGEL